jgi:MYXO-CTERM domain-containing protein
MLRTVRTPRTIAAGLALTVLSASATGSAANGSKPRTPVVWTEGPCATLVDRSTATTVHFEYGVALEDLGPRTEDEVDDSRTHQFFAFARLDYAAVGTAQRLPPWITNADIERAALVDPDVVPDDIDPVDVLEVTSRFAASEWMRITPDDARVPISNAQTAMGVDWDVTAVPPGVYTVWGYTWEPLTNLWAPRPGFVKVIASASEADAAGPGIALSVDNAEVTVGEPHAVVGCADVPAGSTVTLEWGAVEGPEEPQWAALVVDAPISTGPLALEATLPAEAVGEGPGQSLVRLRATVTDPSGRQYVAHSFGAYEVIGGESPPDEGCACGPAGEPMPRAVGQLALVLFGGVRRRR